MKIVIRKLMKFFFIGAAIFLLTYYMSDNPNEIIRIVGFVFTATGLIFAITGNYIKRKE